MKCNKCNAQWQVDAIRSALITVCPFCKEKIETEKTSGWIYFDNTKELLEYVAAEYGNDAMFGRKYFSDHSSPMMPVSQKNLVKQAFDCGAAKILQDNVNADQAHKETAVKQAVGKLIDTYVSAKEAAERVVWEFTNAIGWGMAEPTENTPPPQSRITPAAQPAAPSVSTLMIRAWQFAEDGDWKEAADYFNKVLDANPSYAPAFLGLLCVELKAPKEGDLAMLKDPNSITGHKYYGRAINEPAIKARLYCYIQTINARIDAEQKAAVAEAERKRKAAEEAARKKRVQDAFDNAVKIMNNAKDPDDYCKAIIAFISIDSNYQDINSQIREMITECEQKIATIDAEFKKKYGFLLDRFSAEGKAQAEELRRKKQVLIDIAKAEIEARYLQIQQKFDADHMAWKKEVARLKAGYEATYKNWEFEINIIEVQAERRKSQGLCPHCGGTLKWLLLKKCVDCGKMPSERIEIPPMPPQPNYPPEPRMPQMPSSTLHRLDPDFNIATNDIEAYISGDAVYVKSAGVVWRVIDVQGNKAKLRSDKGIEAYIEGDRITEIPTTPPLVRSNCDFAFYLTVSGEFCYYFGFYADGTLIEGSNLASESENYSTILGNLSDWHSKGRVVCKFNGSTVNPCDPVTEIRGSATSSSGTVDFNGKMKSNGDIQLDSYSHINSRRFSEVYRYIGAVKNGKII